MVHSPLRVFGEIRLSFLRDVEEIIFEGLAIDDLNVVALTSAPFIETNHIANCIA
jgi:hypothetical protein